MSDDAAARRPAADVEPSVVRLPAHGDHCLGCGPANSAGLGLRVDRVGDSVVTDAVFPPHQVGAPGLAHGGAVATACDDLFAYLLHVVGEPAVTRTLQVEYLSPVILGVGYRIQAQLDHREGRRLYMRATGCDDAGAVCFEAHAVFVVVPITHFERFGSPDFTGVVTRRPAGPSRGTDGSGFRVDP